MSDFVPNLDDGELWLPSDILPHEKPQEEVVEFPSELTYMDELAQQLSTYVRLEKQQQKQTHTKSTKQPPIQNKQIKPIIQLGTFDRSRIGPGFQGNGGIARGTGVVHSVYASDQGGYRVDLTSCYQLKLGYNNSIQGQSFDHTRGRVLQKHQNQGRNRFLPLHPNRGGFVKGTGVFLPRAELPIMEVRKRNGQEKTPSLASKKNARGKEKGGTKRSNY
ncbi:hypothetical protein IFM89_018891 [Coptis chinensis]|uniref:Uncharacterized protein n=1 Tax=Coptis chinensis TaxID=261450 RepID=A0A835LJS8_9MAGN|nr:hypothetical protein IFM89_018891 [Coptis chinensis]